MLLKDVSQTVGLQLPPTACKELEGSFIVWNMVNFVMHHYFVPKNYDLIRSVISDLIEEQLKNDSITDNAFGLIKCVANECKAHYHMQDYVWEEWSDDNGDDIMHSIADLIEDKD